MAYTVRPDGSIVCETADEAVALSRAMAGTAPPAPPAVDAKHVVGAPISTEQWRDVHENDKRSQATVAEYQAGAHWFDRLAPSQRECIELRIAGKWPHEIAAQLGKSIGAVYNRLDKGRKQLAKFRAREAARIARETAEPAPVGAPFSGGGVKRMPKGKFRWTFRIDGDAHYGPNVATEVEAYAGLDAKLAELAPLHPRIARFLQDVEESVKDDGAPLTAPEATSTKDLCAVSSNAPPQTAKGPPSRAPKSCGKCARVGHNARTCPGAQPADDIIPTTVTDGERPIPQKNIPNNIPPAARLYVVAEDFEEEDGTAWIEGDVWEAIEPTGETVEDHQQWTMRRQGDGVEGVGFPSLHPFISHDPRARATAKMPAIGIGKLAAFG